MLSKKLCLPIFLFLLSFLVGGCSFSVFSNNYTARSNGPGNWSIDAGAIDGFSIPYLRIGHGFSNNIDLGVTLEESFGSTNGAFWGKFSIINHADHGLSLALDGSYSVGSGTHSFYVGPIISYKSTWLEPYASVLFKRIKIDEQDIKVGNSEGHIQITHHELNYLYYTSGLTIWPLEWIGINLHASYLQDFERGSISHQILMNGGIVIRL